MPATVEVERGVYRAELRAFLDTDGGRSISGYAARYGVLSHPIKDSRGHVFRERIANGAFKRILDSGEDVRMLVEHNPSMILGRRGAGTLQLESDSHGLKFRCSMPDTSYGRDAYESIKRGDVNSMSFGFLTDPEYEDWADEEDKELGLRVAVRTLRGFKKLTDISAVTYPAYPGTSVDARSFALATVPDRIIPRTTELTGFEAFDVVEHRDGGKGIVMTVENGKVFVRVERTEQWDIRDLVRKFGPDHLFRYMGIASKEEIQQAEMRMRRRQVLNLV